mgnify:CR=1 FL=1
MEPINSRIGDVVAALGLKKSKFAERLNVSQPFVSELCSGKKQPSDRTISDICRIFGVSELWLRTGQGEMFVSRSFNEELVLMVNQLLSEKDDSFRKQFIAALLEIPQEAWPLIKSFCEKLTRGE